MTLPGRWSSSNEDSSRESGKEKKSSSAKAKGKHTRKTKKTDEAQDEAKADETSRKKKKKKGQEEEDDDAPDPDHQHLGGGDNDDDDDDSPDLDGLQDLLDLHDVDPKKKPASRGKGSSSQKKPAAAATKSKPAKKKDRIIRYSYCDSSSLNLNGYIHHAMSCLLQDDGGFNDASKDVPFQFEIEGSDAVKHLGPIFHWVGLGTLMHECQCTYVRF